MKNLSKITSLLLALLLMSLIACEKENEKKPQIYPLTFEKSNYSAMIYGNRDIMIRSGNKDYTITSGDENIIKAKYMPSDIMSGDISITGLKKGTTTLTVKDNIIGQTEILNITVTQRYLNFKVNSTFASVAIEDANDKTKITKDILDNAPLKSGYILTLIGNEENVKNDKLYVFSSVENAEKGEILHEGSYKFEKEGDLYYLNLNFKKKDETISHKFFLKNSENTFSIISKFLALELEEASAIRSDVVTPTLITEENLTDVYKTEYPKLITALLDINILLSVYNPEILTDLIK